MNRTLMSIALIVLVGGALSASAADSRRSMRGDERFGGRPDPRTMGRTTVASANMRERTGEFRDYQPIIEGNIFSRNRGRQPPPPPPIDFLPRGEEARPEGYVLIGVYTVLHEPDSPAVPVAWIEDLTNGGFKEYRAGDAVWRGRIVSIDENARSIVYESNGEQRVIEVGYKLDGTLPVAWRNPSMVSSPMGSIPSAPSGTTPSGLPRSTVEEILRQRRLLGQ